MQSAHPRTRHDDDDDVDDDDDDDDADDDGDVEPRVGSPIFGNRQMAKSSIKAASVVGEWRQTGG